MKMNKYSLLARAVALVLSLHSNVVSAFVPSYSRHEGWLPSSTFKTSLDSQENGFSDHQRSNMKILFVCVGNSCRSQMAEGLARNMGFEADSAGTHPADKMAHHALTLLETKGIVTAGMTPKNVELFEAQDYDMVISMGCGVKCSPEMPIDEDWGLDDPVGNSYEVYEATAAEIERRLMALKEN
jgi:arsenate reductase